MIFWALEERKKRRERRQAEREKLRAESRAEAEQRYDAWLAKVAEEKSIPLAELLPPPQEPLQRPD